MVRTNSMVLELGFQLPNFEMLNANSLNNKYFNYHNLDNRHLLLMFICAHCPFVKYIENQIFTLSKEIENTVQTVAISSNDIFTIPTITINIIVRLHMIRLLFLMLLILLN